MAAPLNGRQALAAKGRAVQQTRANYSGAAAPQTPPTPQSNFNQGAATAAAEQTARASAAAAAGPVTSMQGGKGRGGAAQSNFDQGAAAAARRAAGGTTAGAAGPMMPPRAVQAPQVRDRRFSQSQAAYQQGAPPAPGMMPLAYIPKQPENTGRVGGLPTNTTGQAREATPLTDLIRTKQFGRAAGGYSARQPDAPQPQQGTPPAAMDVKGGTTVGAQHNPYGNAPQQMAGVAQSQQSPLDALKAGAENLAGMGQEAYDRVTGGGQQGRQYGPQDGAAAGAVAEGEGVEDNPNTFNPFQIAWDSVTQGRNPVHPTFGDGNPAGGPTDIETPGRAAGRNVGDIVQGVGEGLMPTTEAINEADNKMYDKYYGDVRQGLSDQDQAAQGQFSSDARAKAEAAAREDMNLGINNQRGDQMRQLLGMQGRGGAVGQGQFNAVNNSATMAQQAGERGLTQDTYERQRQATQDLLAALQGTNDRRKGMRDDVFSSNKDTLSLILGAVNPLSRIVPT